MDRRRWLQYEHSRRAPDRCLFGAAPQRREEPAQRTSAFLSSREETVKIGVGLLPYIWIGSVWQKRRPVITNLSAYRGRVSIDATSLRMVALGMATSRDNAIRRSFPALAFFQLKLRRSERTETLARIVFGAG